MPKSTAYKSLQIITRNYLVLIKNEHNFYKQLKQTLISAYNYKFIESDVSKLDIRNQKNKATLLNIGSVFLNSPVISKLKLQDRGWSLALINKYAGEADLVENNPQLRDVSYLYLYSLHRIETIEKDIHDLLEFNIITKPTPINKDTDINEWIASFNIKIPSLSLELLLKNSIDTYNNKIIKKFEDGRSFYTKAHILEQLCINYLRHECTQYDKILEYLTCVIGGQSAHDQLRQFINKQINLIYPSLKNQIYQYQLNNNYIETVKPKLLARK